MSSPSNGGLNYTSQFSPGEFYQQLASELIKGVHTKEVLSGLGNSLINLAEHAYTLRQMVTLEYISQVLLNLPLACEYRSIARYYQALCIKRQGQFHEARTLLERVAEKAPIGYKARAIVGLGSIAFDRGDFQAAMPFYIEAGKAAIHKQGFDPLAAIHTQLMLAVLKSIDGDNHGALADLEQMFPLARAVGSSYPPIYYHYLNSLAVELTEVGRLEEAARACRISLIPSFANAYPEVRETWNEIMLRSRRASRSFVSFARTLPPNVIELPQREASESVPLGSKASVINLDHWKRRWARKKAKDGRLKAPQTT